MATSATKGSILRLNHTKKPTPIGKTKILHSRLSLGEAGQLEETCPTVLALIINNQQAAWCLLLIFLSFKNDLAVCHYTSTAVGSESGWIGSSR